LKEEMDQLIKNELMPMPDSDVPLYESRQILWEEKITKWTLSILDTLILASNLDIEALYTIRYVKRRVMTSYMVHQYCRICGLVQSGRSMVPSQVQ
jgi:hypothetical protein